MNTAKKKHKILAGFLAFALALILGAGVPAIPAYAATGNVYTCKVVPCYQHPVTGVIEDSGGEASYATGQGMVEGAVYGTGIMEVTSDGNYYLTIRMSLMDYTTNHSFWVQNVGDSGWSTPALGVTGTGTDNNGTYADICIQVPSENCVVRGAMYVEPMGRDVIFYFYPTNYVAGNSTDMNSTMISADTGTGQTSGTNGTSSSDNSSGSSTSGGNSLSGGSTLKAGTDTQESDDTEESTDETAPELENSIDEVAEPVSDLGTDSSLNDAQGLSLSTAEETEEGAADTEGTATAGQQGFIIAMSVLVAGLILIGVAAGVVYYFRKNWKRWGGEEDDDE